MERAADRDTPKIEGRLKFLTGPDVKIFLWGPVLVKIVGDGVRFIIRVGDAADVAEAARPARAVAVPARMASKSKKKPLSWK